jgi:hypothetical protein
LDLKYIEATNFENSSDIKSLNNKNTNPECDGEMSNLENCQKSGNMMDSEKKNKDLLGSKASKVKSEKPTLKSKKTANSIKKTKSKVQTTQGNSKTLVGIKTYLNNGTGKEEINSPTKEEKNPEIPEERPVKQEFIIKPFQDEEQKIEEPINEDGNHTSI